MDRIAKILNQYGPMLSGQLAQIYQDTFASTNDAARQAISRARSPVQKIKKFAFNKNQVFCYLESQYNSTKYLDCLYNCLKTNSLNISVILTALENNFGVIKKDILPSFSISPIKNTRGHRLFSRNVNDLIEYGIITEYDDEHWMINPYFIDNTPNLVLSNSNDRMRTIILNDFITWASKLNIIAYNSAHISPNIAEFAHFQWGATCPSYLQALYNNIKNRPGFVVVDAIYGKQVSPSDISFFINKVNILRHLKNIPTFLPILLIEGASSEAFTILKEEKIFIGVLSNIFDKNYSSILADIYNVFQNATYLMIKDSSKIDTLLDNIAKNEGRFNNVMGDLFEFMVGSFYQKLGVTEFKMNKLIPNQNGTHKELDILISKDNRIIAVECKATKSPLSHSYVEKWLSEIIPVFRKWIQKEYPQHNYEFQLWSIGGFDEQANILLNQHKESTKKYQLNYYNKSEIINLANQYNDRAFLNHIQKHFTDY